MSPRCNISGSRVMCRKECCTCSRGPSSTGLFLCATARTNIPPRLRVEGVLASDRGGGLSYWRCDIVMLRNIWRAAPKSARCCGRTVRPRRSSTKSRACHGVHATLVVSAIVRPNMERQGRRWVEDGISRTIAKQRRRLRFSAFFAQREENLRHLQQTDFFLSQKPAGGSVISPGCLWEPVCLKASSLETRFFFCQTPRQGSKPRRPLPEADHEARSLPRCRLSS